MDIIKFLFLELWPWWLGGIIIGLLVPGMYYFLNTALGVSTGYGNIVKMLLPRTKLKWLNTETFRNVFNWRLIFIAGMIIGAFISARIMGFDFVTLQMGILTEATKWPFAAYVVWFLAGGFLLGFGARLAGGCTSGHSIHGLANFHLSSLVASVSFLIFGALTAFLMKILILGGK